MCVCDVYKIVGYNMAFQTFLALPIPSLWLFYLSVCSAFAQQVLFI